MIRATQLCKDYTQRVIDHVDLTIKQGEFVVVMGRSGSGKSTLVNLLSGMDTPTSGQVEINGQDITSMSEQALATMRLNGLGFVFQQPNFVRSLSILDNIVLPGISANKVARSKVVERAKSLMDALEISEIGSQGIGEVSGGQLQRASICRALINQPKVLFGDEPTGALNRSSAQAVLDEFQKIHADGTTVVLVTHDPIVAARATRVIVFADGQIQADAVLGTYSPDTHSQRLAHVSDLLTRLGV